MKAINLFSFTRIPTEYATEYYNMLALREQKTEVKSHEFDTVKSLVEDLLVAGVSVSRLDGFFFSYIIQHIGKEFDLLKIVPGKCVLNIELKSEPIDDDAIDKQLRQNRYYLSPLGEEIYSFSYVALTGELFRLQDGECSLVDMSDLVEVLELFDDFMTDGIEKLFEPRKFLISPINTPDLFLGGKYFLTQQQQQIKEEILHHMDLTAAIPCFIGITGSAGTGKTLLLYDLVKMKADCGHRCCIIHSDIMYEGHKYLNAHWEYVDIFPAKMLRENSATNEEDTRKINLASYAYIFVDEAHRIQKDAVDLIIEAVRGNSATALFSYDFDQWLSHSEKERDIPAYLRKIDGYLEKTLSKRIRTSVEIASFYRSLLNLKNVARGNMDYSDIDVLYAENNREAKELIRLYTRQYGYTHTRHGVGQEFDKVLIVLDEHFHYDEEGRIREEEHKIDGVSSYQLLYHDLSRVREKLCVLVVGNYELFLKIADIKYSMLDKYQYKTHVIAAGFSSKKLNRLSKAVKECGQRLSAQVSDTASDNVDIIVDELYSPEMSRKIIFNSLKYLKVLTEVSDTRKVSDTGKTSAEVQAFRDAVTNLTEYVREIMG